MFYGSGVYRMMGRGQVVILAYHRVLTRQEAEEQYVAPGMYVLEEVFEAQAQFVSENFEVLSLSELLRIWQSGSLRLNQRHCVLTFDDGWGDNYTRAFPVLKRYKLPASIFLVSEFVGTSKVFWPEQLRVVLSKLAERRNFDRPHLSALLSDHMESQVVDIVLRGIESGRPGSGWIDVAIDACKKRPAASASDLIGRLTEGDSGECTTKPSLLNWAEIQEMSKHGVTFGSHSCTHAILTSESFSKMKGEVENSGQQLKMRLESYIPVFCYPNGSYDQNVRACVAEAGYAAALSLDGGAEASRPRDLYALKRVMIHNDISRNSALFALHSLGWSR